MKINRIALTSGALFLASSAFAQPATFPLVLPIGGVPYQDWTIVNYVDRNTGPGAIDYRGGNFTYNGHNAIDFTLANFADMDAGVPVYAAASGAVTLVHDGEFDRCSNVEVCGDNPNWIRIEHASGIATEYLHLKRGSISVANGQNVVAGQQIALVGSSGLSSDAHLHFAVFEDGVAVETYTDPNRWWPNNPLPYAGDEFGTLDHGLTHHVPTTAEFIARPIEHDVFFQSDGAGQQAFMWSRIHGVDAGDPIDFYFFRPNGTLYAERHWIAPSDINYGDWTAEIDLPNVPDLGTWQVFMQLKGTTVGVEVFDVVAAPQIRSWVGGSGNWGTHTNWSPAISPYAGDAERITPSDGQARTITYEQFPFTLKSFWLDLTGPGANRITFNTLGNDLKLVDGFIIGYNGRATFNQTGGSVTSANTNANTVVGYQSGGDGVYNMSGNSILSVADNLIVGTSNGSRGTFNQTGGTTSTGARLSIGDGAGANGTYSISGSNSTLNVAREIYVGNAGTGALSISGGASVYSRGIDGAIVANLPGISGTVTVTGPGSLWRISGGSGLTVGKSGNGSLAIQAGAQVTASGASVGLAANSQGTVVVEGVGSKLFDSSFMAIGSSGIGSVTVAGGGELQSPHVLVNRFASGNGTLIVTGAGSKVTVDGEMRVADEGIGTLRIENGGFLYTGTNGYLARNSATANATALVTGQGSNWAVGQTLNVGGAGVGRLTVANGGGVSALNGVIVNSNGILNGDGTILGHFLVNGVVAPGTSTGKLRIIGSYAHNATGRLQIEIASPTSFDGLDVFGNLQPDGSLEVNLIGGYVPVGTKSFDILDWTGGLSFTFDSIQLPTLGGLLTWNTSQLYTTGVLSVIGPPPPPGDFNEDSKVDAADYVWWRKNGGTQAQFNLWRANFGNMAGSGAGAVGGVPSGSSADTAVPEPRTALLLAMALIVISFGARPKVSQIRSSI